MFNLTGKVALITGATDWNVDSKKNETEWSKTNSIRDKTKCP